MATSREYAYKQEATRSKLDLHSLNRQSKDGPQLDKHLALLLLATWLSLSLVHFWQEFNAPYPLLPLSPERASCSLCLLLLSTEGLGPDLGCGALRETPDFPFFGKSRQDAPSERDSHPPSLSPPSSPSLAHPLSPSTLSLSLSHLTSVADRRTTGVCTCGVWSKRSTVTVELLPIGKSSIRKRVVRVLFTTFQIVEVFIY